MYFRLANAAAAEPLWWLLSKGRRGAPAWPTDTADWRKLIDYAEANGLGSVIVRQLPQQGQQPPAEIQRRLQRLDEGMSHAASVALQQSKLVGAALSNAQIPVYWLKGVAWGESLYHDLGIRPMRDLDFIVPEGCLKAASEALTALGYVTDPLAGPAGQHLPRFTHPSGVKIDVHHRIVPTTIYGFPVRDPDVPWGASNGVVTGKPDAADALFHLAHMIIHVFHHSFYNLRLMHLFDIKLALSAWDVPTDQVIDTVSTLIPRRILLDILGICDELFDAGGGLRHNVRKRNTVGVIRNGAMPLLYPVSRIPHPAALPAIFAAESARCWFVTRRAPGRFGRPPAMLHPPT